MSSLPNAAKYSALRRVTLYLHRALHTPGNDASVEGFSSSEAITMISASSMQQAPAERLGRRAAASEASPITEPQPSAPSSSSAMLRPWSFEDGKTESRHYLASGRMPSGGTDGETNNVENAPDGQEEASPSSRQGLVGFDVRLGLSLCEFRLWSENRPCVQKSHSADAGPPGVRAVETATNLVAQNNSVQHPTHRLAAPPAPSDSPLVRFGIGNSSVRLNSAARSTSCACVVNFNQVYLSLGPAELNSSSRRTVSEKAKGYPQEGKGQQKTLGEGTDRHGSWMPNLWRQNSAAEMDFAAAGTNSDERMPKAAALLDAPFLTPSRGFPVAVPFLQFTPSNAAETNDCAAAAADAATALLMAMGTHGAPNLCREPPLTMTFTALQKALSSHRLRLTTRWGFPPPYPGEKHAGAHARGPSLHWVSPDQASNFSSHPAGSRSDARSGSLSGDYHPGRAGPNSPFGAALDSMSSASRCYGSEAAEQEVLIEDLVDGRCFLVPSAVHGAVASRSTWRQLAQTNADVSIEASVCLKALLHSLEIRCNPVKLTVDWGVLAELVGRF